MKTNGNWYTRSNGCSDYRVKGRKLPTAKKVAEYGYAAMMKGKTVAVHGLMNYLMANSVRFIPRAMVVILTRMIQDKAK